MAHINFLETPKFGFGQFQFKELELNYFWMMVASGVVVLLMLTYGIVQRLRVGSLNEKLEAAVAEVKNAGGAPATTPSQKTSLMDGLNQRIVWSPILNAITNATPDTISLNYIKGVAVPSRSMQIEGFGADVLAATRYQEALSQVPFFSKVLLLSSSEKTPGTVKGEAAPPPKTKTQLTFEIQGWLK